MDSFYPTTTTKQIHLNNEKKKAFSFKMRIKLCYIA